MSLPYYDISPVISPRIGVFPGDVGFRREASLDFVMGHHLHLSSIQTTLHLGAHADGPNHYRAGLAGIGERDLTLYMGQAQVIDANVARGARIRVSDLRDPKPRATRVLFKTGTFPNPDQWNSDFASLSPELIEHMAQQGVRLLGIDTPSVDPEDSKKLESHNRIADLDLAILEGLILDSVPEGLYTLIALPLRIEGADAAPVRAVLLPDPTILTRDT